MTDDVILRLVTHGEKKASLSITHKNLGHFKRNFLLNLSWGCLFNGPVVLTDNGLFSCQR